MEEYANAGASTSGAIKGYERMEVWWTRLYSLRDTASSLGRDGITHGMIKDLKKIAGKDANWMVRRLARDMRESVMNNGDFRDTYPYRDLVAEKRRETIEIRSGLRYNPESIWWARLRLLERFGRRMKWNPVLGTRDLLHDLGEISEKEDDPRVREEAVSITRQLNYGVDRHIIQRFVVFMKGFRYNVAA